MRKALYLAALAIAAISTACTQEQADDESMGNSQESSQEMRRPHHQRTNTGTTGGSGGTAGANGVGGNAGTGGSSGVGGTSAQGGSTGTGGSTAEGGASGVGGSTSAGGASGSAGGPVSGVFASCPAASPVAGLANPASPSYAKPARGVAFAEPTFGTCMARATDHAQDGLDTFARNDYSRRQPFNADNSYYLVYSFSGSWYLYDASKMTKIRELTSLGGDAEPQWHPTDPNKLYYVPTNGGMKVYLLDVVAGTSEVAADFTGKLPWSGAAHVWTKSEGSPSRDARYWGFMVQNSSFNTLGYIVWDMQANQLVGSMTSSQTADHVSMSPSGNWFTISWDAPVGTYAYSRDFSTKKQLHHTSEHSDLALGANGNDVYVSIDYESDGGDIFMVDLETGVRTALLPTYTNGAYTAMHFSGKGFGKPGWAVISTYDAGGPSQWYGAKVFALQLAANPKVYELAFHHSVPNGEYWAEPHAAVSRDFSRIVFNSNWDAGGSSSVEDYMLLVNSSSF